MSEQRAVVSVYAGELHHPQHHSSRFPQSPSNALRRRVENPNRTETVEEFETRLAWELFNTQVAHANWAAYRTAKWIRDEHAVELLSSPEWCAGRLCDQMRVAAYLLPYTVRRVRKDLRELAQ